MLIIEYYLIFQLYVLFCTMCDYIIILSCKAKRLEVSDYFTSKQILPFGFAEQYYKHIREYVNYIIII